MTLPNTLPQGRHTAARLLVATVLCLASGGVLACKGPIGTNQSLTIDLKTSDPPGTITTQRATNMGYFHGCDAASAHPVDVLLEVNGLTPVSTITYNGETYVTYQLSATSPLFFFPVDLKTSNPGGSGGFELVPARESPGTRTDSYARADGFILGYAVVGIVSRAGMQPVANTRLGAEVVKHTRYPYEFRHTVSLTVNIQQPTCTLTDAAFTLNGISADVVSAVGDSSSEQSFPVKMQCDSAGIPVKLTLTDANDPAATGSLLKPTAHATAEGVQVELLRGGTPVNLGVQWDHGTSGNGEQNIDLQARYTRVPGALKIGEVEGQAVLTADYR
ncbi:fimbrial protein [Stenotrophomonas sp.]|uniref:fimbrial protein n=1 Tax=Stenotrophomonas sp. TaxID=69392 RepID=UPI0028A84373|nr:fimbrial protein [Stenotrophomonas sp.]